MQAVSSRGCSQLVFVSRALNTVVDGQQLNSSLGPQYVSWILLIKP